MEKIMEYLPLILEIIGVLVLVATVVVRLTPGPDDDSKLGSFAAIYFKVMEWLPTIGINPRTKQLKDAYKELNKK